MKNILITGGTGFVGKNLINFLTKKRLFNIFSTFRSDSAKKQKNVHWIKVKSLDKFDFQKYNFDVLIDLAWYDLDNYDATSHIKQQVTEHETFYINLLKNNKNLNIYGIGTCLEYGFRKGRLIENMICKPSINYAIGKNNLKKKIFKLKKKYNFRFNWLRFFYIYGIGQEKKKLFTIFSNAVKKKKKYFKMSSGNQSRDYSHIKKIINLLFKLILINKSNGIINVCSGKPTKVVNLIKKWKKEQNSKIILKRNVYSIPEYEPFSFYGCNNKIKKIFIKYG